MKVLWLCGFFVVGSLITLPCVGADTLVGSIKTTWNDEDEVAGITFTTFEDDQENEYLVKIDSSGKKLAELDGRRVLVNGTTHSSKGKRSIEVSSFQIALKGWLVRESEDDLEDEDDEEQELQEETIPFARLIIEDGEEDGEGVYYLAKSSLTSRMLQNSGDARVEVVGSLSEKEGNIWIEPKQFHHVMRGQVELLSVEDNDEAEEDDEEDDEGGGEDDEVEKRIPHFVERGSDDAFAIRTDTIGRALAQDLVGKPIEIVATIKEGDSFDEVTVHRFCRLFNGRLVVETDEDDTIVKAHLELRGSDGKLQVMLDDKAVGLYSDYAGRRVTVTGSLKLEKGIRWIKIRSYRG